MKTPIFTTDSLQKVEIVEAPQKVAGSPPSATKKCTILKAKCNINSGRSSWNSIDDEVPFESDDESDIGEPDDAGVEDPGRARYNLMAYIALIRSLKKNDIGN